ncbi:MAG: sodium:glutamate symporter, partial [Acidobacteria bacterium]|nr:sodium:glutamate symporter [Acidobacteriota bacterium]
TIVGIGMARAMNAPALLGIICGALTLTGGPATGLAFADTFERAGITGASSLIIASATFGIFIASLVGNPTATALIRRFRLASPLDTNEKRPQGEGMLAEQRNYAEKRNDEEAKMRNAEDKEILNASALYRVDTIPLTSRVLLHHLLLILGIMGVGALIGLGLTNLRVTLPGYVGAMVVASIVRNVDDRFGWFKINMRAVEALAFIALALFLVIALMDLKLWQLAGLAVPMLVILVVQVVLMIAYAVLVTFILMGRDYEAAVTASGHIGFGLGITPNAVANMEALVERYKPAPQSFLIVPVVGAFFIDFSNALIITLFINLVR